MASDNDFDAAKWALLPEAQCADEAAIAREGFLPSARFTGSRPGYAFKRGPHGVGYYVDAEQAIATYVNGSTVTMKDVIDACGEPGG